MTTSGAPRIDAALLARIEDAGLNASAPTQQRWLDGWLVRLSAGKAKRARCVNALALGRRPAHDKLAACERLFADAGLPMIVRITPFTLPPDLDALLDAAGLRRFDDTRVMGLADIDRGARRVLSDGRSAIRPVGVEAFAQRVGQLRGSPLSHRQAHAERLAQSPVPVQAFEMTLDGQAVAYGQFTQEGDLAGLYDVFTPPAHRGRGHAERLCRHLLAEAEARGARHAYLQVEADNVAARTVYHRIGFVDGYAYHYRTRDPSAA